MFHQRSDLCIGLVHLFIKQSFRVTLIILVSAHKHLLAATHHHTLLALTRTPHTERAPAQSCCCSDARGEPSSPWQCSVYSIAERFIPELNRAGYLQPGAHLQGRCSRSWHTRGQFALLIKGSKGESNNNTTQLDLTPACMCP